jgi:phage anti-repressor protein
MDFQRLDIVQLINNSPLTNLSNEFQTTLLTKIQNSFTNDQQQMFVASFYSYLNYNSKTDFVINLDDVWKWCGFTRKDSCKKVLEKHFTINVDYKSALRNLAERKNEGGFNKETILMNIETFKSLCMLAGTIKSKEIRQYYLKLEELMQETLKEESEELRLQLDEKDKKIKLLEHKPHTHGFNCWKKGYIYLINDFLKPGHYKIGMATDPEKRLRNLNTGSSEKSLRLYYEIETYDIELCERTIQSILQPFNIKGRKEWFYFSDDNQLKYAIHIINNVKTFLDNFNFNTSDDLYTYIKNNYITNLNLPNHDNNNILPMETNIYKLSGQQMKNKTGNYKGVCFCKEKQKFKAELKKDYNCIFLGYYSTEIEAAKAYNDYALFINSIENTNYTLNDIPDYIPMARDIPDITKKIILENKTSKYRGVSHDLKRNYYTVSIKYNRKTYHLGHNKSDLECAKIYNQQALYFNINFNTKYELNIIPDYITEPNNLIDFNKTKNIGTHSSKYYGVTFTKQRNKYRALLVNNKKQIHLGFFETEIEAAKAYNQKAHELNKTNKRQYKLNIL